MEQELSVRALERAEDLFPRDGLRRAVAAHFGVDVDNPGLLPLLALCVEHDLSPTSGLVHLIPHRVELPDTNGVTRWVTRWSPSIGRDGLLHLARRTLSRPYGYRGHKVACVCANDTFEATFSGDGRAEPVVRHDLAPMRGGSREGWRGPVVGAWAIAYFDGLPSGFFFADIREYRQVESITADNGEEVDGERPAGAWRYTAAMIEKCAESRVIRQGLGVTGFVPLDELLDVEAFKRGDFSAGVYLDRAEQQPVWDFGEIEDEELRGELRAAVDEVNGLDPLAWPPAKCAMAMRGRSRDELVAVLERIRTEIKARREVVAQQERERRMQQDARKAASGERRAAGSAARRARRSRTSSRARTAARGGQEARR